MALVLSKLYQALRLAGGVVSTLTLNRNFHNLKPAGSQYYDTSIVTLPVEWVAVTQFATGDETNQVLWGDDHLTNVYVNFSSTGLTVWISGQFHSFTFGDQNPHDGGLHTLQVSTAGSVVTCELNGVLLTKTNTRTLTPYVGDVQIKVGTSNSAAIRFDGYIADFKLTTPEGDIICDYTFNTTLESPYILSSDTILGVNVVSNNTFEEDLSGWQVITSEGNETTWTEQGVHIVSDGSASGVIQTPLIAGNDYLVKITVEMLSGNGKVQLGSESLSFNQSGTYYKTFNSVTNSNIFIYRNTACDFYCSEIVVQEIPSGSGVATAINLDTSDVQKFTFDNDRWVGPNTLVNGSFETTSGWVLNSEVIYNPTEQAISFDNAGGDPNDRAFYRTQNRHKKYEIELDADITSGIIRFYDGTDYTIPVDSNTPNIIEVINADNNYAYFIARADTGFTGTIRSIAMRPILEIP